MALAAVAPIAADAASQFWGLAERSANAPTRIRRTAETSVAKVAVYGWREPGATGMPRTFRLAVHCRPSGSAGQAALVARLVR